MGKWKHQLDATILSILFHLILLSTCFGCYTHPSSGASNMYNQVWYNLITYEQLTIQQFFHKGSPIPEQNCYDHNNVFKLAKIVDIT